MLFLFLAQTPGASPAGAGSGLLGMLPFVFLIVIMYYVMIRPQMRRQKEQAKLVSSLNVKLEMEKTAVTNVVKSPQA
jgi:hypothetical protein